MDGCKAAIKSQAAAQQHAKMSGPLPTMLRDVRARLPAEASRRVRFPPLSVVAFCSRTVLLLLSHAIALPSRVPLHALLLVNISVCHRAGLVSEAAQAVCYSCGKQREQQGSRPMWSRAAWGAGRLGCPLQPNRLQI